MINSEVSTLVTLAGITAILTGAWWKGRLDRQRERFIRTVLRQLAKQRIATILQPGNIWVIENAPRRTDREDEALKTCMLRGWVELIHEQAIPSGELTAKGELPEMENLIKRSAHLYRITSAGWDRINLAHTWIVWTFAAALLTLLVTVADLVMQH